MKMIIENEMGNCNSKDRTMYTKNQALEKNKFQLHEARVEPCTSVRNQNAAHH